MKVAVVATHPIQYQAPWFRQLAQRRDLSCKVYFAAMPAPDRQGTGFGIPFQWDIDLLSGYEYEVLPNARENPALDRFTGSSIPSIYRVLAQARPDAVILTGWHSLPLVQALWACMRLRIPRIVRGESNALKPRPARTRLLHRLLLPRYDAFLSIGKSNRDFYRGYGIPDIRIFDSLYFVDNLRFQTQYASSTLRREDLRSGWNVAPGSTCFLFAGKLEPKKRILDLLDAVALSKDQERIHLLIAGAGDQLEAARGFATARSLPVTFCGFLNQSEITDAYAAADCLVLPSDYGETWGLVVNEAMACGLPAIVSDRVGCGPDLVESGVTGSVFRFGDIHELSHQLVELASKPELRVRMGQQANARIQNYSSENAAEGAVNALRFVLNLKRKPAMDADSVLPLA